MDDYQVIGIDLGGTAIKLGQFSADGNCLQLLTLPTPQPVLPKAAIATMVNVNAKFCNSTGMLGAAKLAFALIG